MQLALSRRGSTEEVALLVAEFGGLDEGLGALAGAVDAGDALFIDDGELAKVGGCGSAQQGGRWWRLCHGRQPAGFGRTCACSRVVSHAARSHAPPEPCLPLPLPSLPQLATDIPDLRVRLGLGDTQVFGGQGFSLAVLQSKVGGHRAGRRGRGRAGEAGRRAQASAAGFGQGRWPQSAGQQRVPPLAPRALHSRPGIPPPTLMCCLSHPAPAPAPPARCSPAPQIKDGSVKVVDGVLFGVRGVKLLLADVGAAGKLFWRAVRGEWRGRVGGWGLWPG